MQASRVTVGTGATLLAEAPTGGGWSVIVRADAGDIYLGGAGVTTSTGLLLEAGQVFDSGMAAREKLYGVCTSGTVVAHVMEIEAN